MRGIVIVLLTVVLLIPMSAVASPRPSSSCENIEFAVEGFAVPDATGLAVFATTVTGDLAGASISGHLTVAKVTSGGLAQFEGSHTFVTSNFGTFTTSDNVVSTPSGLFNATFEITDGGSGVIHAHGTVDAAGNISGEYHGRLCQ